MRLTIVSILSIGAVVLSFGSFPVAAQRLRTTQLTEEIEVGEESIDVRALCTLQDESLGVDEELVYGTDSIRLFYYRDPSEMSDFLQAVGVSEHCLHIPSGENEEVTINSENGLRVTPQRVLEADQDKESDDTSESSREMRFLPADLRRVGGRNPGGDAPAIFISGSQSFRELVARLIVEVDEPVPSLNLQVYGLQISGNDSQDLAEVMSTVRARIDTTQSLLHDTYSNILQFSRLAQAENGYGGVNNDFLATMELMGYSAVTDASRTNNSLVDIAFTGALFNDPESFYRDLYDGLEKQLYNSDTKEITPGYEIYVEAIQATGRPAFESFFTSRGLTPTCTIRDRDDICWNWTWSDRFPPSSSEASNNIDPSEESEEATSNRTQDNRPINTRDIKASVAVAHAIRRITAEFALVNYERITNPTEYNPFTYQRRSDVLTSRIADTTATINQDIEAFFVRPTLNEIRRLVGRENSVEFSQVGRSTVSTLSGETVTFNNSSRNIIDITPPIPLSDLLPGLSNIINTAVGAGGGSSSTASSANMPQTNADISSTPSSLASSGAEDSATDTAEGTQQNDTNTLSDIAGTAPIAATGPVGLAYEYVRDVIQMVEQQEREFLNFATGNNLTFQANVLRDASAAELDIFLQITDPVFAAGQEADTQNFSRLGTQTLDTTVYIEALDFFDLATFSNQTSVDGGRYITPVIGHLWQAFFGAIPGFGQLFTLENDPRTVLHDSLMLTNAYIVPTAESIVVSTNNSSSFLIDFAPGHPQHEVDRRQARRLESYRNFCIAYYWMEDYVAQLEHRHPIPRVVRDDNGSVRPEFNTRIVIDPIENTRCSSHYPEYIRFRNTQLVDRNNLRNEQLEPLIPERSPNPPL